MMKYLKRIILLVLCLSLISNIFGQQYTHDLKGIKKIKIIMSGSSDVEIESTDKTNLSVYSSAFDDDRNHGYYYDHDCDNKNKKKSKKKNKNKNKNKEMRAIYSSGYDNSNIDLSFKENGNTLVIRKLNPMSGDDYTFVLPKNMPVSFKNSLSGDVQVTGFSAEVEVQMLSGSIELRDVTGPILANAVSGDIEVSFIEVAQQNPMSLISVSGDVEITLPKNSKVNFVMETTSGTSFSNMEMEIIKKSKEDNDQHFFLNNTIKTTLNGGGVQILAKSVSGDIFIKEKKE